jgi:hypothetical protein
MVVFAVPRSKGKSSRQIHGYTCAVEGLQDAGRESLEARSAVSVLTRLNFLKDLRALTHESCNTVKNEKCERILWKIGGLGITTICAHAKAYHTKAVPPHLLRQIHTFWLLARGSQGILKAA